MTMDDALAEWLRLREEADHESRSSALVDAVVAVLPAGPLRLLDLATGTGSNLRYLIPRLPSPQRWTAVDRSPALLELLRERMAAWARERGHRVDAIEQGCTITGARMECHIDTRVMDLGALEDPALFEGRHMVTASALLDLVSPSWLQTLAMRCRTAGACALLTLTYDGRSTCTPGEPEDEPVRTLFNRHQGRNKGLGGPAAGPAAVHEAAVAFRAAGFEVRVEPSDWDLPAGAHGFQRQLIDGWARAAAEESPELARAIDGWRLRRLAHLAEGQSRLTVGHHDLAAWIPRPS
jgi:SAM-dependent methyltransferase